MPWQVVYSRNARAAVRLFCFHYAGGSASAFRNWASHLPRSVELVAVQLPGREGRFGERFITRFDELIKTLTEALTPSLNIPYAVFGHSLGTLIGFEWIRQLKHHGIRQPLIFFASGRRAPQFANPEPPISHLPEADFVRELMKKYSDHLGSVLERDDFRQAFVPQLRADFTLSETYRYRRGIKLECPIVACAGEQETEITEQELTGWQEHTTGRFNALRFPGAHFFIHSQETQLLQETKRQLSSAIALPDETATSRRRRDKQPPPPIV
jgi:medium-chain acyl-[acyl-carrier-protein] hydrolase